MTILWDIDASASDRYGLVLGGTILHETTAGQTSRLLEKDPSERLVVIGPSVPLETACTFAESERLERPQVGVILLRNRLDVGILAHALRAGMREVVQADDMTALADAVRRSRTLSAQLQGGGPGSSEGDRDGKVVTVFSAKGGVGKTTMSTNFATYLASTGSKTLLIDLDLMFGDVAICLQLVPTSSIFDLVKMAGHLDAQAMAGVVVTHEDSGLDILAAPSDPGDAERVPVSTVVEVIRVARPEYDFIVVDTPPSFTEHVLAAIDHSDLTVLITTLDIPALKNLRVAISTLDALGGTKESRVVLLNRADAKAGLHPNDVEAALKHPISAKVPASISVPASINRGVPLILDEPKNPVSLAMRHTVDHEIRQRFAEATPDGVPTGRRMADGLRGKRTPGVFGGRR